MYLLFILILLVGVHLAPALAVAPHLRHTLLGMASIPVLSAAIVTGFAVVLGQLGWFHTPVVLGLTGIAILLAIVRLRRASPQPPLSTNQRWLVWMTLLVCLPLAVRLGFTSFATNDEIYSWNLWAINHVRGEPVDYFYTQVPYPQAFSWLLAWCYQLLGNHELQLPVRFTLGLYPWAMLMAVAGVVSRPNWRAAALLSLLMLIWMFLTGAKSHLDNGLADPMMVAALTVSAAMLIHWHRSCESWALVVMGVSGVLAAYTKQPAIWWAGAVVPLLIIGFQPRDWRVWLCAVLMIAAVSFWLLGPGHGTWNNTGVVDASTSGRSTWEQLEFGAMVYLINKPMIALLVVGALLASWRNKLAMALWWVGILPLLIGWLLLGSYELRLGLHVLSLSSLLIAAGLDRWDFLSRAPAADDSASMAGRLWVRHRYKALAGIAVLSLTASALVIAARIKPPRPVDLLAGSANTIAEHFGDQSSWLLDRLNQRTPSDVTVWAPSNYAYGIFYGNWPVIRPAASDQNYSLRQLIDELEAAGPVLVIDAGELNTPGVQPALTELLALCPGAFVKPPAAANGKLGMQVYSLDPNPWADCRNRLVGDRS